jgi:uncharacterized protein HemY
VPGTADKIIFPNTADARTQHDYYREKHAWIHRLTVGAYTKKAHSPDQAALEKDCLAKVCRATAYPTDRPTYAALAQEGKKILHTGSNDPLVRLWIGQMLYHNKEYEAAEPLLKSACIWDNSHYPWIHAFYALRCLANVAMHKMDRLPLPRIRI